jgi:hypothetical protein
MADRKTGKDEILDSSVITSLIVSVPSFCMALYVVEARISWDSPGLIVFFILGLAVANFAAIVFLEQYRASIGKLTLPALLSGVGLVLLFVVAEAVNRFYRDLGYEWLLPAVILALAISFVAIFRERKMALKCQLAGNSVAAAVLWSLGMADKMAMPF